MFVVVVSLALFATAAICTLRAAGLMRRPHEDESMTSFAARTTALARICEGCTRDTWRKPVVR